MSVSSRYFHDYIEEGDVLEVTPPVGDLFLMPRRGWCCCSAARRPGWAFLRLEASLKLATGGLGPALGWNAQVGEIRNFH
jgi:hypothetical protein